MRTRSYRLLALSLGAVLALTARPATAQSCAATGRGASACSVGGLGISISIARATHLTVSPASTPLTTPAPTHYDAGFAATAGPTLTVRANAPWSLAISATSATWHATDTESEAARQEKPAGDLLWSTAAGGPFAALEANPVTLSSGGAATPGSAIPLFYQTLYAWDVDTPGAYSLQIVFTLSAP